MRLIECWIWALSLRSGRLSSRWICHHQVRDRQCFSVLRFLMRYRLVVSLAVHCLSGNEFQILDHLEFYAAVRWNFHGEVHKFLRAHLVAERNSFYKTVFVFGNIDYMHVKYLVSFQPFSIIKLIHVQKC